MNFNTASQPARDRLDTRSVAEYASAAILSCGRNAPLDEVAALMTENGVHAVVVVDDRAAEPPVISDLDLIAAVASGHFEELMASDVAGTEGVSIFRDDTLTRAAQLLAEHRVSHLVVRNERREPVGILSSLDLAAAISGAPARRP